MTEQPEVPAATGWGDASFADGLVALWLLGCVFLGVRLVAGHLGVRRTIEDSHAVAGEAALETLQELLTQAGVRREVALRTSATVGAPVLYGLRRPTILLPEGWVESLSPEDLRALLAHEVAHVKRRDFLANFFQRLVEIPLFFHPGTWLASRRIALAREELADAWALSNSVDADSYARSLTAAAERVRRPMGLASVGVAEGKSTLLRRVEAIVEANTGQRVGLWTGALLGVLMLLTSAALAALDVTDGGGAATSRAEAVPGAAEEDSGSTLSELSAEFFSTLPVKLQDRANEGEMVDVPEPLTAQQLHIALEWVRAAGKVRPLPPEVQQAITSLGTEAIFSVSVRGNPPAIEVNVMDGSGSVFGMGFLREPELTFDDILGPLLKEREVIAALYASLTPEQRARARPASLHDIFGGGGGLSSNAMTPEQRDRMAELDHLRSEISRAGPRDRRTGSPEDYRLYLWQDEPTGLPQGALAFGRGGMLVGVNEIDPAAAKELDVELARLSQEMWQRLGAGMREKAKAGIPYADLSPDEQSIFVRISELKLVHSGEGRGHLQSDQNTWKLIYEPEFETPWEKMPALTYWLRSVAGSFPIDGEPWLME